ncbi:hypothetical protein Scep_003912 [Stephania cephalantha]|uniref:Uncharacterized protein n=1 Tax=Stephania cephalantha TaxID=152367 RepID=A0AAP0KSW2_9MAGN
MFNDVGNLLRHLSLLLFFFVRISDSPLMRKTNFFQRQLLSINDSIFDIGEKKGGN